MAPTTAPAPSLADIERRARRDFIWTAKHLLTIRPKDEPACLLDLRWSQRYIAENYLIPAHKRNLPLALSVLKSRRLYCSTLFAAWAYHKIRWYRGRNAMIYSYDDSSTQEIFDMVLRFHDYLPEGVKPPTLKKNTQELEYVGTDSRIAQRVASQNDVGRGKTIHHMHVSEVDFLRDPYGVMTGAGEAVPTTGPSTFILETTANGDGGYFHDHWRTITRKREGTMVGGRYTFAVFLPWFWNPENTLVAPASWDPDEELVEMQARYRLTREQGFWYEQKRQDLELRNPGRGFKLMQQEYPGCPEEAFIQSRDSIFSEGGRKFIRDQVQPPVVGFRFLRTGDRQFGLEPCVPEEAPFQVWEPPHPGYTYALGVDVAHGGGGDDSAVCVMRMPGWRVVAEWYDNETSPGDLTLVVGTMARYYAHPRAADLPYVNVEINDGVGLVVNEELMKAAQEGAPWQPYYWEPFDRLAPPKITGATRTGWLTTIISKNVLIGIANLLLGDHLLWIPSGSLQAEMQRTIEVAPGYAQTRGADQVMAWLFALVTCYRKIARWDWPGMGMPRADDDERQPQRITNPAVQDTSAGRLWEPPSRDALWQDLPAGDGRGHWLVG